MKLSRTFIFAHDLFLSSNRNLQWRASKQPINVWFVKTSSDDLLCFFTFSRETSVRRRRFSKPKPTFPSICTRRSQIIGCLDCAWNIHRKRGGTKKFSEYKLIRIGSIIWRISSNASHSGNWLFLASEVNSSRTVSSKRLFKTLLVSWRHFFWCSKIVFGVHVSAEKLRLKLQYGESHFFFSQRKVISKYTVARNSICRKSIVFIINITRLENINLKYKFNYNYS